jgi:hypothetical protein
MAGVAFAVEGDGVGFATESYAASALYATLASLSGALWRIRRASACLMLHCVTSPAMWQNALGYLRPRVGALHPIPMSDIGQRRCFRANIEFRYSFRTICTFLADFIYLSKMHMPRPVG